MSDCLSDQELEQLARKASATGEAPSDRHLSRCGACRLRYEEIRSNLEILDDCMELGPDRIHHNLATHTGGSEPPAGPSAVAPTLRMMSLDGLDDEPPGVPGYEILEQIHRGAQGIVYRARQASTGRVVALKLLLHGPYASHRQKRRFEREIDLVAGLDHPSIVSLYDSGKAHGRHFFAMQHIDGLPLKDYVSVNRSGLRETLALFVKVCRAVAYAHSRGIMHRDLKPNNILVDAAGEPHILDFGLAKPLDSTRLGLDSLATMTGEFFGTLAYTSPEQASCRPDAVDTRSDVYALGVILYELLSGKSPYPIDGSMSEIFRNINEADPRRPSRVRPDLDDDIDTILLRALAKEPADRYQSAEAFGADIQRYLAGRPIEAKPHSNLYVLKKTIQRNKTVAALSGLLLVSLLGFVGFASVTLWRLARERDVSRHAEAKVRQAEFVARQQADAARKNLYLSRIGLAFNAYEDHDIGKMKQMLAACPVELRGWEWYRLAWLSDRSILTFTGHTDDVLGPIQCTGDGEWIATKSRDRTLRVWSSHTGREILVVDDYDPNHIAHLTADSRALISPLADGTVGVWRIPSGERALSLPHPGVRAIGSTNSGRRIASAGGGRVKLWDGESGQCLATYSAETFGMPGTGDYLNVVSDEHLLFCRADTGQVIIDAPRRGSGPVGIDYLHNRQLVVVRSGDGTIELWSTEPPRRIDSVTHEQAAWIDETSDPTVLLSISHHAVKLWRIEKPHVREVLSIPRPNRPSKDDVGVYRSPDERFLAVLCHGSFVLTRADDPIEILTAQYDTAQHNPVRFSKDGRLILSVAPDHTVSVWTTEAGKPACRLAHPGLRAVVFSEDAQRVVTGSPDTISLWDSSSGDCLLRLQTEAFHDFVQEGLTRDGLQIITRHDKGHLVRHWDAKTGDLLIEHTNPFPPERCDNLSQTSDTRLNVVLCVHDLTTGLTEALHGHTGLIRFFKHLSGDSRIATASDDDTCKIWSTNCFGEARVWRRPGGLRYAALSPQGDRVATANSQGIVKLWDAKRPSDPELVIEAHPGCDLTCVAFSPGGGRIVSAPAAQTSQDALLQVWDAHTGKPIRTLTGHTDGIATVSYTPDGGAIVSGGWDGVIRIWNEDTGECLTALAQEAEVWDLAISPDGKWVATGGADSLVRLWNIDAEELTRTLSGHTDKIDALAFSPNGTHLVTADNDGHLICWDLAGDKQSWIAQTQRAKFYNALFTRDGNRIITGGKNQISVWNAHTGRLVLSWPAHEGSVYALDLSADNRELLSVGHASFKIWPALAPN